MNPYAVQKKGPIQAIAGLSQIGLNLYQMKHMYDKTKLMEEDQALRERAQAEQERINAIKYGNPDVGKLGYVGTEQRKIATQESQQKYNLEFLELKERELAANNPGLHPVKPSEMLKVKKFFARRGLDSVFDTMFEHTVELAGEGRNRADIYKHLVNSWDFYKKDAIKKTEKMIERGEAQHPAFGETEQGKFLNSFLDSLYADKDAQMIKADLFPRVYDYETEKQALMEMKQREVAAKELKALQGPRGMKLTTPDGTVLETNVPTGPGSREDMTKKTKGTIEDRIMTSRDQLVNLERILDNFEPEHQTAKARADAWWNDMKEKGGADLSEEDRGNLVKISTFRQDAVGSLNQYIHDMTGAQMSKWEADRLRQGMPDPGDEGILNVFSGDGPSKFESKLRAKLKEVRLYQARYIYALKHGLAEGVGAKKLGDKLHKELPIDPKNIGKNEVMVMNFWAQEKEKELISRGLSEKEAQEKIRYLLPKYFGLK